MTKLDRIILKDLFESVEGLFAYTLYSRYKIEPDKIFLFIDAYQKKGVVKFENDRLELTKQGRNVVLKQLYESMTSEKKFSHIPSEFIGPKIEMNSPYLPNIKDVSKEILKTKKVE